MTPLQNMVDRTLANEFKHVDAILTLGKNNRIHNDLRGDLCAKLRISLDSLRQTQTPIVVSGRMSGVDTTLPEDTEAYALQKRLADHGITQNVYLEERALDTIANFVYSRELLDKIGARRIAVVVGKSGATRALETGRYVLGSKYELFPAMTDEGEASAFDRLVEFAVRSATQIDFSLFGVESGDAQAFANYLNSNTGHHPFHTKGWRRHACAYGLGMLGMSVIKKQNPFGKRDYD